VGVGAALVAAVAYNLLHVGLYGMFGPTLAGYLADKAGLDLPWVLPAALAGPSRAPAPQDRLAHPVHRRAGRHRAVRPTLLGLPPGSTEAWALPASFAVAAVLGVLYGRWQRSARPDVYQGIGLGADALTAR
jgi:hypothetical protein